MKLYLAITILLNLYCTVTSQTCETCCVPDVVKYATCAKQCMSNCSADTAIAENCGNPAARLSSSEQSLSVDTHKMLRVSVGASNMMGMTWDDELSMMAQKLVDSCQFDHGELQLCSNKQIKAGQNLYIKRFPSSTDPGLIETKDIPADAANAWYAEKKDYSLANNTCAIGAVCGHYTQVVWGQSNKIGCAWKLCRPWFRKINETHRKTNDEYGVIYACNYLPGGNMFGKKPYTEGEACTNCASVVETTKAKCVDSQFCEPCPDNSTDVDCRIAAFTCYNDASFDHDTGVCSCSIDYFGRDCRHLVANGCENGGVFNSVDRKCDCAAGFCGETCSEQNSPHTNCPLLKAACKTHPVFMSRNCTCECLKV